MPRSQRTPYVILGLLGLSGREPRSGYEIRKAIDSVISSIWHESNGQIYPALKSLSSSGLIEVRSDSKSGRRKKLYAITPKGRQRLRAWLGSPVELGRPREELILKLFFGSEADLASLVGHVEAHRDRARAGLAQCREWEKGNASNPIRTSPFVHMTIRAGILHSEASLRWAEESLEALAAIRRQAKP
jgi:DNA-binding PadR family transcriptional regulator